jgi:peroxiredoxin (alkyl hydroperoxide reductase subunit C)
MSQLKDGCVKPAGGPLVPAADSTDASEAGAPSRKETRMSASVGKEAIDFEANAYIEGVGFEPVKLSDYRGKWIVLCFYPGDFTFV